VKIEACEGYLFRQIALVRPVVVATLGNFATKVLSGRAYGITSVHGQPHRQTVGDLSVTLYALYHPAAALYTPAMLRTLEEDFARLPAIIAASKSAVALTPADNPGERRAFAVPPPAAAVGLAPAEQLELF